MLEFADELVELDGPLLQLAHSQLYVPCFMAEVPIADGRIVGAYVTPADVVLGLRAWDDANDGAEPVPWTFFDIEKLTRMALHQSGLAFEALVSAHVWGDLPARELASATVTSGVLDYYRDLTIQRETLEPWRWRTLLTGALLARDGVVSQSLPTLCDVLGVGRTFDPTQADAMRQILDGASALPERPRDYDFANDLVVELRLEAP